MNMRSIWYAGALIIGALSVGSVAAQGPPRPGEVPPLIHPFPAQNQSVNGDYECRTGGPHVTVGLSESGDRVTLERLEGYGRAITDAERTQVNQRLAALENLDTFEVGCLGDGISLGVAGKRRGEAANGRIVILWSNEGTRTFDVSNPRS
jgi:hypothetical protein